MYKYMSFWQKLFSKKMETEPAIEQSVDMAMTTPQPEPVQALETAPEPMPEPEKAPEAPIAGAPEAGGTEW